MGSPLCCLSSLPRIAAAPRCFLLLCCPQQPLLHCSGPAVTFPTTMPSQNAPLHRSFPVVSFPPSLSPQQPPSPALQRPHDAVSSSLFSVVPFSPPTMQWVCGVVPAIYAISLPHAASSLHSLSLRPFPLRAFLLLHKLFLLTTVSLRGPVILLIDPTSRHCIRLFFSASASTDAAGPSPVELQRGRIAEAEQFVGGRVSEQLQPEGEAENPGC